MTVVLDASALLAVLLEEPGQELVVPVMRGSVMSAVNASECFQRATDKRLAAGAVQQFFQSFEVAIASFGSDQALATANLRGPTRHVGASLGDRACLALGLERGLPVLTADQRLAPPRIGIDIRLIR